MGKSIQLSITDPCHENWDSMTVAEQGRFCASCQKQVVDFTTMSDAQLAAFFKKPSTSSVCGRFYDDQLNRDMQTTKMSARAVAQGGVSIKKPEVSIVPLEHLRLGEVSMPQKKNDATIAIKGKVVNENNNPIPFASVLLKGGSLGAPADSNGVFTIEKILRNNDFVLVVSSVGYKSKEVVLNKQTDFSKALIIQLTPVVMDEVVVVGYQGTRTGRITVGMITTVGTKIEKADTSFVKPPAEKPAMIKVYPNPVLSGTAINIGCEKLEEGYYSFQLFNQAGQQLQNKQVWIDAEARIMNMEIPAVSAGTYILTLTHQQSHKRFSEKIIIQ
jgi:CarboxypepD_reg-like domain